MLLTRKSVELLAPAGTWEVLEAAIRAGADAIYLGGKRFNMRMHRTDTNFDDEKLKKAIEYAHAHGVKLYITINNLLSDHEIEPMREYLLYLETIQPDALLVQDLAVLELVKELNISIPLHTSVMMNTHNEHAINKLKEYGITRIVVGREMTLSQLSLFKERTGIEVEYFMHGDMCISQSGQCYHSGILFGQSGNRGRCLKPCRWAFKLIDENTKEILDENGPGPYKLALKDMCMYRNIPELIQAGVHSFKIEGRMRTAAFVERIVKTYRKAIDSYIADPTGYVTNEEDWSDLYENRSRDFSTCFALGKPDSSAIGFTGEREPRFFSQAVKEASVHSLVTIKNDNAPLAISDNYKPNLSVRVADMKGLISACQNGADVVYVGGETFRPNKPWTIEAIREAIISAEKYDTKVVVTTPRATMERECGELEQLFTALNIIKPAGIMVSNLGSFNLAKQITTIPLQTDFSFNTFNHLAAKFLKDNGATMATTSLEATFEQIKELLTKSFLPIELIVHGATESMLADHNIPAMSLGYNHLENPTLCDKHFALLDTAGEIHPIRIDQYGRNHILFAKDLCLLPYISKLIGAASYRIEAQHYTSELVGIVTKTYREELNMIINDGQNYHYDKIRTEKLAQSSPRALGVGAFRYRISR
ncbi:peptidase U32 family protein [Anaerosinus massiliensis]|uniref:peptidase U32 family protein n=1 Tax=Massilibacillus massiliensis TaxID=1806837 RepID=UPI000AFB0600|nr:U32 family peptidase [Massilibacillus massiliensis]